ncbi:MAG TPA: glycoside hydrolase family 3 N-terminal domain-containing protein [Solirubrobacterales bacterium]|nr:glycoside hydrolase family 3 N-terminal domain-containing protein [Solirubrobacterales bacterium]
MSLRLRGASSLSPTLQTPPIAVLRFALLARKLTFWRRRAIAGLTAVALGVGIWVALADGTTRGPDARESAGGTDAGDLTVRLLAGERIVAGFDGRHPPRAIRRMIREGRLAGVILFSDNLGSRDHARRLIRRLQGIHRPRALRDPLLVMIDQEGGLVKRLSGAPDASAHAMGRRGADYSRHEGARTARNLKRVGVNVNLAPVLDVGRPGSAISAERRSFGSRPDRVVRIAIPFATALERRGVAATGKHFPGLGAATESTDLAVQRIRLRRRELRRIDERPFRAFAAHDGDMVMISTAIYTHFSHKPAAFSKRIATRELRDRVGFAGVSISDALDTVSARRFGGAAEAGAAAARAGTDLLLFTDQHDAARAGRALRRRLRSEKLPRRQFEGSAQRVLDLRATLFSH